MIARLILALLLLAPLCPGSSAADSFDRAQFSFRAGYVYEEGGHCELTIEALFAYTVPFTIRYRLIPITAVAGIDFVEKSGQLSFDPNPNGGTSLLPLEALDDHVADGTKTFRVEFYDFSLDPTLTAATTASINDGEKGYAIPSFHELSEDILSNYIIQVRRLGDFDIASSVTLFFEPETPSPWPLMFPAEPGVDYIPDPITVNFAPGQSSVPIRLPFINDSIQRYARQLRVTLIDPTPGVPIDQPVGIYYKYDDETVDYFLPSNTVLEGPNARLVLRRIGPVDLPASIDVRFVRGETATAGADFELGSAPVQFAAGQVEAPIPLAILDDAEIEPDEFFAIEIATPNGPMPSYGRILDNDYAAAATPIFPGPGFHLFEEGGLQTWEFRRAGPNQDPLAARYTFRDGSASRDIHFRAADGVLRFPSAISSLPILVEAIDNSDPSRPGTFFIDFFSDSDGTPLGSHEVIIYHDDAALDFNRLAILPDGRWRVPVINHTQTALAISWTSDLIHWFDGASLGSGETTFTFNPLPRRFYSVKIYFEE